MIDPYIDSLITRMLDKSDDDMVPYDSSKTISWAALREAETLTDHKYIDNIIENIDAEKKHQRRERMYFIVGRICEINFYQKGVEFLIDRLDKETNKYTLSGILDRLEWLNKSPDTDLTKIIALLTRKDWLVRYSAIKALCRTNNNTVDVLMMKILNNEKSDKYEISYAMTVIYNCGSYDCYDSVLKQTFNKSRNIKEEAKGLIKHLDKKYGKVKIINVTIFETYTFYEQRNDLDFKLRNLAYKKLRALYEMIKAELNISHLKPIDIHIDGFTFYVIKITKQKHVLLSLKKMNDNEFVVHHFRIVELPQLEEVIKSIKPNEEFYEYNFDLSF